MAMEQGRRVKNLFFVGASTQPGTGLPTVLISARLVVERVRAWAEQVGLAHLLGTRPPLPAVEEVAA